MDQVLQHLPRATDACFTPLVNLLRFLASDPHAQGAGVAAQSKLRAIERNHE